MSFPRAAAIPALPASSARATARPRLNATACPYQEKEGQLDVLRSRHSGNEVEGLEHEANRVQTDFGNLLVAHLVVESVASNAHFATRGRVNGAQDIQKGALSGARLPHNDHEFSSIHAQVNAANGGHSFYT